MLFQMEPVQILQLKAEINSIPHYRQLMMHTKQPVPMNEKTAEMVMIFVDHLLKSKSLENKESRVRMCWLCGMVHIVKKAETEISFRFCGQDAFSPLRDVFGEEHETFEVRYEKITKMYMAFAFKKIQTCFAWWPAVEEGPFLLKNYNAPKFLLGATHACYEMVKAHPTGLFAVPSEANLLIASNTDRVPNNITFADLHEVDEKVNDQYVFEVDAEGKKISNEKVRAMEEVHEAEIAREKAVWVEKIIAAKLANKRRREAEAQDKERRRQLRLARRTAPTEEPKTSQIAEEEIAEKPDPEEEMREEAPRPKARRTKAKNTENASSSGPLCRKTAQTEDDSGSGQPTRDDLKAWFGRIAGGLNDLRDEFMEKLDEVKDDCIEKVYTKVVEDLLPKKIRSSTKRE